MTFLNTSDSSLGYKYFRDRFWICLILTLPVVFYSGFFERFFGFSLLEFPGSNYIPLIVGSVIFFYGGLSFLISGAKEMRAMRPGIMTLTSLAIISAYVYSIVVLFFLTGENFFWLTCALVVFMLFGRWIEIRSLNATEESLNDLNKLLPEMAQLKNGRLVFLKELALGDVIIVKPGEIIPVDGIIEKGESEVNESLLTKEAKRVKKSPGSQVIGGMKNITGELEIRATKLGNSSYIAGVIHSLSESKENKTPVQLIADKATTAIAVIAIMASLVTAIIWILLGSEAQSVFEHVVAVLVVACPHALALAVPLTGIISTRVAAENGILIQSRKTFDLVRKVNLVVFDKTGTLITGKYTVVNGRGGEGFSEQDVIRLAACVEFRSEHAIGKAIVAKALDWNLNIEQTTNYKNLVGVYVQAEIDGKVTKVGGQKLIEQDSPQLEADLANFTSEVAGGGGVIIYVVQENKVLGVIVLENSIRQETVVAVKQLQDMNISVVMLTTDSNLAAQRVANAIGVSEYYAELLPEEKENKLTELKQRGGKVAFVGDGVSDISVMAKSDLGIVLGANISNPIESAGVTLIHDNPLGVPKVIKLSRLTYKTTVQSLWWVLSYNFFTILFAAGILAPWSLELNPAFGPLFMSLSSVIVAVNAQSLHTRKL